jgi:hypothetical protein
MNESRGELNFKNVKDKHPGMKLVRLRDNNEMELLHIVGNERFWMARFFAGDAEVRSNIWPDDEVVVIE